MRRGAVAPSAFVLGVVLALGLFPSDGRSGASLATYREEVVADSPASYWRLGESAGPAAADEQGLNPGSYTTGVTLGRPSALTTESDTSASFDGVDDSMLVPDSASLDMTTAVTLELWARRNVVSGKYETLVGKPGDGRSRLENYSIWLNTSDQFQAYWGNGSSYVFVLTAPVKDRRWHHVVAVHDGTAIRIYLDGVLQQAKTVSLRLTANANPLTVARTLTNQTFFNGHVDELAVYPTALSAERIAAHFAKGDVTAPTITLTSPAAGSSSTDLAPTFGGVASTVAGDSPTVAVNVWAGTSTSGTPARTLAAGVQPDGSYSVEATPFTEGQWTARAEQADERGNIGESGAATFRLDVTPPIVTISSKPANPSSSTSASFGFTANETSTFECRLDGAAFAACTSPKAYSGLGQGPHTFEAQARDTAGNTGSATTYSWTIDTNPPPVPTIDSGPPASTNVTGATFTFSGSEPGATFECRRDGGTFSACTSPQSYTGLADGGHVFEVRARDAAGNTSAVASRGWTIDATPPPAPAIDSGPAAATSSATATFVFSDTEAGVAFECRLDGGAFTACSSPRTFNGVPDGAHTFEVRAGDAAGNFSAATSRAWTVDATPPPTPTIDSGPAAATSSTSATLSFSDAETGATFECRLDGGTYAACTSPQTFSGLAEGTHTFAVRALDAAGNASVAASRSWTVDATPPSTPSIDSGPPLVTTATTATLTFSHAEEDVTFECRLDGAAFAACTSPQTLTGLADGAHAFEVRAQDAAGNLSAATSRAWTVDATPPPAPAVDSGPPQLSGDRGATFAFSDVEPGATFECRRDGAAFAGCTSPKAYTGLADGPHTFEVRARDAAGNLSPATAHNWTIDATPPPAPTIESGPPAVTNSASATFTFSDTEAGVTFECRLDGSAFALCTSPQLLTGLPDGAHTFEVRARDAAGNESLPASRIWMIDATPPPAPTIDSGPPPATTASSATLTFSSTESGVTFECRLDGADFAACTSPRTFTGLADGPHSFEVRAHDAAGNTSSGTSRDWTVDATPPPAPAIDSGPTGTTAAAAATFAFSDSEAGVSFECRLDGGTFTPCTSPHDLTGLTDGAHTFDVRARDTAGNASIAASRSWTVDMTPPPAPVIDSGPPAVTSSASATLTFIDSEAGVTFECRLDGAAFATCTSPQLLTGLTDGAHTFEVRARDAAGNESLATSRVWTIDATPPPAPTIDSGPPAFTNATSATFTFADTEAGVTFECRLDGAPFQPCTSPRTLTGLADGAHTFDVQARDTAGNTSPASSRAWSIDATPPPAPTIDSGPTATSNATAATVTFSDSEPGVSFECRLDGGIFTPCTSPHNLTGLTDGPHTFETLARDPAGNASAPSAHEWTVDATGPVVVLTTPADGSVSADATPVLGGTAGTATGDAALVEVELWAGASASGPPAHVVSAGRQPDASFSVEAPLLAEGQWTARARQGDAAGNFGLSAAVVFAVQLAAPTVTITDAPPDPSPSTSASFGFTAGEPATFECSLDSVAFTTCTSPQDYTGLAEGPHTFDVRARTGGGAVGAPTRHTWTVTTPGPPAPTITAGPANPTISTSASFTFSAGPPAVAFECRIDTNPFEPCASPEGYGELPFGPRVFEVRSLDASGNASDVARYEWTIITPPPAPTIGSGPSNPTAATSATFTFSDTEPGVTFDCTLDGSPPTACTSPKTYTVSNGAHTFTVKAVNAQGGRSEQVSHRWTVDTLAPPSPSLDGAPSGSGATFTFADAGTPASASLGTALPPRLPESTGSTFHVSPTGSDGAPGTEAQPWRTVQRAFDALAPGQRALVHAGTYTEDLEFSRAGTAAEPITVAAAPGEVVVLHAASTSGDTFPVQVKGSYLRLEGFVIENAVGESSTNVYFSDGAHHVELVRNEIRFSQDQGVFADATTSHLHVLGNRVHDNGLGHVQGQHQSHGLYLEGSNDLVANNVVFSHQFGFGIQLFPQNTGTIVVGNTVVANGQSGILVGGLEGVGDITIRNNVFAYNRLYGIDHDGDCPTGPVRADNNVIWGNRNGAVHLGCPATIDVSGGNTLAQPSFVEEAGPDYRLLAGSASPGIDAALPEYALPEDVDGVARPRGPAADMGAHENGVRFECRLDGAAFAACASPQTFTGLGEGAHTFDVRAVDATGNASAPVGETITVAGAPPPEPSITAGPTGTTGATDATFAFSGDADVTFECRLDAAAFAVCTSPQTYTGLGEGAHTFEVRAVDAVGQAGPVAARAWTIDATPPGVPSITAGPTGLAADASASFEFSGEPDATLECRLDGAPFAACTSPQAYTALADGMHTFELRAVDPAQNAGPSASRAWTIDTTPPAAPSITAGPTGTTAATDATFTFSAEPDAALECRLDGAAFAPCTSPQTYSGLADGAHSFEVRAADAAGNVSATALRSWTVDGAAPTTTLTGAPPNPSGQALATFAFTSDEPASFECRLDGAAYAPCASPQDYTGLADGTHAFDVRATDAGGNTGPTASHSWTVDTTPPAAPTIDSAPSDPTTSRSAVVAFSGEPGVVFECRLDGTAYAACTSPQTYAGLADGTHTFEVRAADTAGNVGPAGGQTWTVDGTPPAAPSITSAPGSPTGATNATFAFSSGETGAVLECRLDGAAYAGCTSPKAYTGLADGTHTFDVRALDSLGNVGEPASHGWTVDATPPPAPSITSGPANPTGLTSATFTFADSEAGATFECLLDAGAFAPCVSGVSYAGLADGAHTFSVRAADAVGNTSAATSHAWTIETGPSSGAPQVRAVSSEAVSAAVSISIALPAGTLAGDLLLAVVAHQGGTARNMTPPAGWTAVPSADYAQGTNARIHGWYRFAGESEPASYTFTVTGGSGQDTAGGILAIAGANAVGPVAASLGQINATNSTSATAPSLTPPMANTLLVFGGGAAGSVSFTPPTAMTEQFDRTTTGTYKIASSVAVQELASAGATGTRIAKLSSPVKSVAIAIAIAPQ